MALSPPRPDRAGHHRRVERRDGPFVGEGTAPMTPGRTIWNTPAGRIPELERLDMTAPPRKVSDEERAVLAAEHRRTIEEGQRPFRSTPRGWRGWRR